MRLKDIKPGMYFRTLGWIYVSEKGFSGEVPPDFLILIVKTEILYLEKRPIIRADGLIASKDDIPEPIYVKIAEMSQKVWNQKFERVA